MKQRENSRPSVTLKQALHPHRHVSAFDHFPFSSRIPDGCLFKKKKKDNNYTECLKTPFVFCLPERDFWTHSWVIGPTVQPCVTHESRVNSDGLIKSLPDCLQTGVMSRPTSPPLSGLGVVLILLRANWRAAFSTAHPPPLPVQVNA